MKKLTLDFFSCQLIAADKMLHFTIKFIFAYITVFFAKDFIESKENFEKRKVSNPKGIEPEYQLINNNIGYIMVPGFNSANKEIANNFAEKIQNMIKKLDSENNIKGWVVDLRKNTGGNMYPMIAGLGSLVGEGNLGYFVAKNRKDTWKYEVNVIRLQRKIRHFL